MGGYLPFSFDVTDALQEERNILTIKVKDYSDTYYYSRGKQKLENGGMFYTAQSGIWQTVWMEKVPEYYIKDLKITPLYDQSSVMIQLEDAAGRKDIDYDVTVTARTMWPLKTSRQDRETMYGENSAYEKLESGGSVFIRCAYKDGEVIR